MDTLFKNIYQHPLLSEDDLQAIASLHRKISFSKGDIILKEGRIADEYYILENGLIRAFVHKYNGDEITTDFFTGNDLVIVPTSLFQRTSSQENLQALTDCVLWKVEFNDFQQLFHRLPGFVEGTGHANIDNMPQYLKDSFLKLHPDPAKLQNMFEKDSQRMIHFKD